MFEQDVVGLLYTATGQASGYSEEIGPLQKAGISVVSERIAQTAVPVLDPLFHLHSYGYLWIPMDTYGYRPGRSGETGRRSDQGAVLALRLLGGVRHQGSL